MTRQKGIYEIVIRASQKAVWDEITSTGHRQPFYWDTVLETELVPGKAMRYKTADGKRTLIVGKVLEVEPYSRFTHTFRFSDLAEDPQKVTFFLESVSEGTRLTVTHEQLDAAPKHAKRVDWGWPFLLGGLKAYVENGRLPLAARLRVAAFKLLMPLQPRPRNT